MTQAQEKQLAQLRKQLVIASKINNPNLRKSAMDKVKAKIFALGPIAK